jgi:GxxExxY protein
MLNAGINIRDDLLYQEESGKILEACKAVYKEFGGSFKESVVDNALTVALEKQGLVVESQKRIDIYFSGVKVGVYVPDKVVNGKIMIELKCKPFLCKEDEKQFWRYLKATEYKLGFLINFSPSKLEIKRRIYDLARNKRDSI